MNATASAASPAVGVTLGVVVVPEALSCAFSVGALTVKPPVGYSATAIAHGPFTVDAAVTVEDSDAPATFQNIRADLDPVEALVSAVHPVEVIVMTAGPAPKTSTAATSRFPCVGGEVAVTAGAALDPVADLCWTTGVPNAIG